MAEEFPPDFVQHLDAIPFGDLPLVVSAYHGVVVACSLKRMVHGEIAEAQVWCGGSRLRVVFVGAVAASAARARSNQPMGVQVPYMRL
jgi:hypothetical protein